MDHMTPVNEYSLQELRLECASTGGARDIEESKEESSSATSLSKNDPSNIKFILFQSQNVIKGKKKTGGYKNEANNRMQKITVTQRSRLKQQDNYFP